MRINFSTRNDIFQTEVYDITKISIKVEDLHLL